MTVTEVRSEKGRFGQRMVVQTGAGEVYTLGAVTFERWADDLAGLLVTDHRGLTRTGNGLVVTATGNGW
jgi:hypothetical protein